MPKNFLVILSQIKNLVPHVVLNYIFYLATGINWHILQDSTYDQEASNTEEIQNKSAQLSAH